MALGGAFSGLGSMMGGKAANRPRSQFGRFNQSQRLMPYGGTGPLNMIMGYAPELMNYAMQNAPFGPNPMMNQMANNIWGQAGGFDMDLPGVHIPNIDLSGIHGPGGYGLDEALAKLAAGAGGVGVPKVKMSPQQIANFLPEMNPFLENVIQGDFLDQANPYVQDVVDAMTSDAARAYTLGAVPQIESGFSMAGRTGSGAHAMAQAEANRLYNQEVQQQSAGIRMQLHEAERQRMQDALGIYSAETIGARGNLTGMRGQDVQAGIARMQANAQMAMADAQVRSQLAQQAAQLRAMGMIAEAEMTASLAMHGNQMELQNYMAAMQAQNQGFGQMMGAYGIGQQQNLAQLQGAMLPMDILGQYAGLVLPPMAQFGTQTSSGSSTGYQQGPQVSPIGNFLTGGAGGALAMRGLQQQGIFGPKGGGGFSPFYGQYPGSNMNVFAPYNPTLMGFGG
jgi:hypothetical protein